jgi:CheY-like chemotaxis protein
MQAAPPIVLIEDDEEDIEIFRMALSELGVEADVHCFTRPNEALDYLKRPESMPGLILCDMRLTTLTGVDLRRQIAEDERLHYKAIPFVLMSTSMTPEIIQEAYLLPVQGIFIKEPTFSKYVDHLRRIIMYWSCCVTPTTTIPPVGWL